MAWIWQRDKAVGGTIGKAAPDSPASAAQLAAGPRFNPFSAHSYVQTRLPDPGVQNYAYTLLGLVEFSPIGPSEHNRKHFEVFQPPPLFAAQAVAVQGLGGLVQGQMVLQPLVNPNNVPADVFDTMGM